MKNALAATVSASLPQKALTGLVSDATIGAVPSRNPAAGRVLFVVLSIISARQQFTVAHHGNSEYAVNEIITLQGKLTRVDLIDPHSWLYFDVTGKDGKVSHHRCEMRSAQQLRRAGWTPALFPVGQQISIEASPNRADPNSCYLQTLAIANGTRMDRYGQYAKAPVGSAAEVRRTASALKSTQPLRRPTGEPNISGDWATELQLTAPREGAFAPRADASNAAGSQRGAGAPSARLYGGTELTELGAKAAAEFKREDNPRFRCESTSIVFDWTFDGPVNRITQTQDTVVIEYGWLGLKRTVHMNLTEHPKTIKASRAGHSIGRWQADTLIVDTVGFLPGYLATPVRNSDKLHVVEEFSLDSATMSLTRRYWAEDPVYLKGRYSGTGPPLLPSDAPYNSGRCKELNFIDYSKQQKR